MRVGVFDSGVGGLTVLKSLLSAGLFEEIIYYGDTARVPYGIKDKNTIIRYSLEALEFFKNFNIDIFISACNTVSAYALEELKESKYCDIVGVLEPGILAAAKRLEDRSSDILVLGTKATVSSGGYQKGLSAFGYHRINQIATSLFIPIVEEGIYRGHVLDAAMKHYFEGLKAPDAVILGCTHFPLISDAINTYFAGKPVMIHSGNAIVEYLEENYALKRDRFKNCEVKYFASENPEGLKKVAKLWL